MGNTVSFSFDFDDVFEGIKQGVIRQLAEEEYTSAYNTAIDKIKSEIVKNFNNTYSDIWKLKDEIKEEAKNKLFNEIKNDVIDLTKESYLKIEETLLKDEYIKKDIVNKVYKDFYKELYDGLYHNLYKDIYSKLEKQVLDNAMNDLVVKLSKDNKNIKSDEVVITKEEYEQLKDRDRKLNALECGGVDNWQWYGECLKQYYNENNEE